MTVQGPIKEQQPDGLSHGGGGAAVLLMGVSSSSSRTEFGRGLRQKQHIHAPRGVWGGVQCGARPQPPQRGQGGSWGPFLNSPS